MVKVYNGFRLEWLWLGYKPEDHFSDVTIVKEFLPNPGIVLSVLYIKKLTKAHSGIWSCLFMSIQGNHSKSTTIMVISDDTKYAVVPILKCTFNKMYSRYCPITKTNGNKGSYIWPKTIVNHTVVLPCKFMSDYYNSTYQTASYFCSENGTWQNLDTARCYYISDTTRILEGFSKVNSSILESARHLKEYTSNISIYKDTMDLVYTVDTIENYIKLQPLELVSNIMMDVVSNLINLPWNYLKQSNEEHQSCSKLVGVLENTSLSYVATSFQRVSI